VPLRTDGAVDVDGSQVGADADATSGDGATFDADDASADSHVAESDAGDAGDVLAPMAVINGAR
jgi:hypothetical protein